MFVGPSYFGYFIFKFFYKSGGIESDLVQPHTECTICILFDVMQFGIVTGEVNELFICVCKCGVVEPSKNELGVPEW